MRKAVDAVAAEGPLLDVEGTPSESRSDVLPLRWSECGFAGGDGVRGTIEEDRCWLGWYVAAYGSIIRRVAPQR